MRVAARSLTRARGPEAGSLRDRATGKCRFDRRRVRKGTCNISLTAPPPAGRPGPGDPEILGKRSRLSFDGPAEFFFGGLTNKMPYGYPVRKSAPTPLGGSEPPERRRRACSAARFGETLRLPHITGRRRPPRSLSTSRLRASWNPLTTRSLTRFPKGPPPGAFGRDAAPARRATAGATIFLDGSRERPRFSISLFRPPSRRDPRRRGAPWLTPPPASPSPSAGAFSF